MPRTTVRYARRDPAEEARKQAVNQFQIQRQAQASAYSAAKFQEWQANAQQRQQNLQYRNEILQSQAEMAGLKQMSDLYDQGELDRQVKMYWATKPVLLERLKQANIRPGSPEFAAEISAFAQDLPDAFAHVPEIQKSLMNLSHTDATAAEIAAKAKTFQEGLAQVGLKGTSFSTTAKGDFDVKATRPLDDGLKTVGLSPTEFLNHVNAKQGKFDDQGKFTQSLSPGEQANAIQFQAGAKKDDASQLVTHSMPLEQFNRLRAGLGVEALPVYSIPTQQEAVTSPTPTPTPAQPETGARRTINGQLAEWDGQGWSAVQQ